MQKLFVDIETTGLDPNMGAVPLEYGFLLEKENGDIETLTVLVCPSEEQFKAASPKALEVNGITWERLTKEGVSKDTADAQIWTWMLDHNINKDTTVHVGQNSRFDLMFLRHFMGSLLEGINYPFDNPIDVIGMAKDYAAKSRTRFTSFSGANIALAIGVEPEPALHTALGGVQAVKRNYDKLVQLTKKG